MKHTLFIELLFILFSFFFGEGWAEAYSQTTSISGTINSYTPVSSVLSNNVTVNSAVGFSTGDRVLLIQMKGAIIDITNTAAFGTILKYNDAGNYEFATIASITGNTIYFTNQISRTYTVSGLVQLISVPQYENVNVTATLSCLPWDGAKGGILVFEACGTVTLNATIDVNSKGFRGASAIVNGTGCGAVWDYLYNSTSILGAKKGEGITISNVAYEAGRGALANGGGGGNTHNSGGAGGGNYEQGGHGGDQAQDCGAVANGGIGGVKLAYSNASNKIFLGGGGGSGHANNNQATGSTNGGGIVIIKAGTIIGNNNSILANGNDNMTVAGLDGAGGAGAGGTVLLDAKSFCKLNVSINGGRGGYQNKGNPHGPGGGGGGGILWVSSAASGINASCKGGAAGLAVNGTPFGATAGKDGGILTGLVLQGSRSSRTCKSGAVLTVSKDTSVCSGNSITLTASGANSYTWSPAAKLNIATGDTVIASPTTTTTYSVVGTTVCKSDTAKVTVTVNPNPKASISSIPDICEGYWEMMTAFGGITYLWSTGSTTDTTNVIPSVTTSYSVTVTDNNGCSDTASTIINVHPLPSPSISGTFTICEGQSTVLTASGGTNYSWNTGDTVAAITVPAAQDTINIYSYIVTATDNYGYASCSKTTSVTLTINPLPSFSLGNDTVICETEEKILHAGNFTKYLWQDGTTNSFHQADKAGTYSVQVTDSSGCTASDTISITPCIDRNDSINNSTLWIPNVFTPNKDGKNDIFSVVSINLIRFEAYIFNRWGEQLYKWNDENGGWDGTFKGKQCPDGVYVYIIKAKGVDNINYDRVGHLTLIR